MELEKEERCEPPCGFFFSKKSENPELKDIVFV